MIPEVPWYCYEKFWQILHSSEQQQKYWVYSFTSELQTYNFFSYCFKKEILKVKLNVY